MHEYSDEYMQAIEAKCFADMFLNQANSRYIEDCGVEIPREVITNNKFGKSPFKFLTDNEYNAVCISQVLARIFVNGQDEEAK